MFKPYVLKRAVFMLVILLPTLLILQFTGHTSNIITMVLAGVTAGVSVIIFPDPEHLKKIEEAKKNENTGK
jgi:hypothetical protein